MDYEKAYKEALARARALNEGKTTGAFGETVCEYIFPELIVSADEKIRRTLLEHFRTYYEYNTIGNSITIHDIINWLEKQGKQNPADKVKQKFKVGDWVVTSYGKVNQVITVDKDGDGYTLDDDVYFSGSWCDMYHLWTIIDAKDGDVLQLGGVTAIFQKYIGNGNCRCYCSVYNGEFEIPSQDSDDNSYGCIDAIPATKEQRDTLMKAMADAGWEWNKENKELKKQ